MFPFPFGCRSRYLDRLPSLPPAAGDIRGLEALQAPKTDGYGLCFLVSRLVCWAEVKAALYPCLFLIVHIVCLIVFAVRLFVTSEGKKKKRKPRYPKNFDPLNPGPAPDAERYLHFEPIVPCSACTYFV